jgi:nitrite reductase/ring-hydroxylating ferredoxin subunit
MARQRVGRVEELGAGASLRFRVELGGRSRPAFAVRYGGVVRAFVNQCLHREVELDLGTGRFFDLTGDKLLCRAHGATYEPETGACAGGLCPKGAKLHALPIVEEQGELFVEDGAP